ncbi:MAG: hypothetical protein QOH49_2212 [Acidobacteriota bacterium]|jgi:ElaB/YqjD/DUF883 family membrane-anchored ribosome-binding protein|nr:hypothetical protein [Acidobacteriota bacterium]
MAEERNVGLARATDSSDDADQTKAVLQRRMEEARESISQTVTEIKDTVVTQYQQVKENISDTLDWREQYKRHTLPFTLTAFAVGTFVGYTVMGAFKGDGDDYEEEDDSFDRIEKGTRSYAAQPVLGRAAAGEHSKDVGPETRPSYSSGYQAPTAPQAQGLASYASSAPAEQEENEEPKGPGLVERFKGTKAYDKLQDELSTLGERALEELSRTAQTVIVPVLLNKLKSLIGIDLSTQREVVKRGNLEHQTAKATAQTAAAVEGDTSGTGAASARAAAGGTEGYGAS